MKTYLSGLSNADFFKSLANLGSRLPSDDNDANLKNGISRQKGIGEKPGIVRPSIGLAPNLLKNLQYENNNLPDSKKKSSEPVDRYQPEKLNPQSAERGSFAGVMSSFEAQMTFNASFSVSGFVEENGGNRFGLTEMSVENIMEAVREDKEQIFHKGAEFMKQFGDFATKSPHASLFAEMPEAVYKKFSSAVDATLNRLEDQLKALDPDDLDSFSFEVEVAMEVKVSVSSFAAISSSPEQFDKWMNNYDEDMANRLGALPEGSREKPRYERLADYSSRAREAARDISVSHSRVKADEKLLEQDAEQLSAEQLSMGNHSLLDMLNIESLFGDNFSAAEKFFFESDDSMSKSRFLLENSVRLSYSSIYQSFGETERSEYWHMSFENRFAYTGYSAMSQENSNRLKEIMLGKDPKRPDKLDEIKKKDDYADYAVKKSQNQKEGRPVDFNTSYKEPKEDSPTYDPKKPKKSGNGHAYGRLNDMQNTDKSDRVSNKELGLSSDEIKRLANDVTSYTTQVAKKAHKQSVA